LLWDPHPILAKQKRNRVRITGSRATVSASPIISGQFLPACPIEIKGWKPEKSRRAVKMGQARRLAATLNGLSLTSGELSRIDLLKIHICSDARAQLFANWLRVQLYLVLINLY
jgi:hypothetical protein